MQDALHVDAHVAEEIAFRRRGAKRETEGEGRRRGKRGMSRSTRRRLVEIDGVGLARRMGGAFERALFDIDMARLGGESLEALVDHVRLLCLAEEGEGRKRVVWGQGVYVRVNISGHSNLKKKTK